MNNRAFLTAEWKHLVMLNYEVEPDLLRNYIPANTELDFFHGKTFLSVVGFLFHRTRVLGLAIPFHQNFEEINLRFYVRSQVGSEWRRGVVFIKEIVPRWWIANIARLVYRENYIALPTRHHIESANNPALPPRVVSYAWKFQGAWNSISVRSRGEFASLIPGSIEEFIAEHYWGYTKYSDSHSLEYEVKHPAWRVAQVESAELQCDVSKLYGAPFAEALSGKPASTFLADGSSVSIFRAKAVALP